MKNFKNYYNAWNREAIIAYIGKNYINIFNNKYGIITRYNELNIYEKKQFDIVFKHTGFNYELNLEIPTLMGKIRTSTNGNGENAARPAADATSVSPVAPDEIRIRDSAFGIPAGTVDAAAVMLLVLLLVDAAGPSTTPLPPARPDPLVLVILLLVLILLVLVILLVLLLLLLLLNVKLLVLQLLLLLLLNLHQNKNSVLLMH